MLRHLVPPALTTCVPSRALAGNTKKPNILFVIADDLTFRDIGCYGGQAHTPHIDKLATDGTS